LATKNTKDTKGRSPRPAPQAVLGWQERATRVSSGNGLLPHASAIQAAEGGWRTALRDLCVLRG
jgi:hypothetical protein